MKKKPVKIKEIYWVCMGCGCLANGLTCLKKYGELPKQYCFEISTYHTGKCDVCGNKTYVTEKRDFFYPSFDLIEEAKFNFKPL